MIGENPGNMRPITKTRDQDMSKSQKDFWGVVGMVILLVLSGGMLAYVGLNQPPSDDKHTLCQVNDDRRSEYIIIVDKTDPLPKLSLSNLKEEVLEQRDSLALQDRLWIFVMTGAGVDISSPLFSECRPLTGTEASWIYHDPSLVEKQYKESFEAPLDTALKTLLTPGSAEESPIAETLGRIAASNAFASKGALHIVFVTDLLQNSPLFSTYNDEWRFRPNPQSLANEMLQDYGPVFSTIDLTILVIDRHVRGAPSQKDLGGYWRAFLKDAGVSALAIRTL